MSATARQSFTEEQLASRYTKTHGGPNPYYACDACGQVVPGLRELLEEHASKHTECAGPQWRGVAEMSRAPVLTFDDPFWSQTPHRNTYYRAKCGPGFVADTRPGAGNLWETDPNRNTPSLSEQAATDEAFSARLFAACKTRRCIACGAAVQPNQAEACPHE